MARFIVNGFFELLASNLALMQYDRVNGLSLHKPP